MADSQIVHLAKSILQQTEFLQKFIDDNKLPEPTFAPDGPQECIFPKDDPKVETIRQDLVQKAYDLRALILGPHEYPISIKHNELLGYAFVTKYNIPQLVPMDKAIPFEEVAKKINFPAKETRRFLRFAISRYMFIEPQEGYIAHNAISKSLANNDRFYDFVGTMCHEHWMAASKTIDAVAKWPNSEEPNETGFSLFNNTDKTFFQVLDDEPWRAKRFGGCMSLSGEIAGTSLEFSLTAFDWSKLGNGGTVVDCGGSHGKLSQYLAKANPNLKFINQDLPPVIAGVTETPETKSGQVKHMEHSFFDPQPVKGADAYVLRWILHDWSDKYAVKILQGLIPALKAGARVLVIDEVMPAPNTVAPALEWRMRYQDLTMLAFFNASVREASEWQGVFERADPRFKLQKINSPDDSLLSVMELVWEP